MNNILAKNFYLNVIIWSLFCLTLGLIGGEVKALVTKQLHGTDEITALQAILTIRRLQSDYAAKHRGRFAPNFDELIKAESFDDKFAGKNPVVNNYVYNMIVTNATAQNPAFFSITADPVISDEHDHFYFDNIVGTTKVTDENRPAKATDPSI